MAPPSSSWCTAAGVRAAGAGLAGQESSRLTVRGEDPEALCAGEGVRAKASGAGGIRLVLPPEEAAEEGGEDEDAVAASA